MVDGKGTVRLYMNRTAGGDLPLVLRTARKTRADGRLV